MDEAIEGNEKLHATEGKKRNEWEIDGNNVNKEHKNWETESGSQKWIRKLGKAVVKNPKTTREQAKYPI